MRSWQGVPKGAREALFLPDPSDDSECLSCRCPSRSSRSRCDSILLVLGSFFFLFHFQFMNFEHFHFHVSVLSVVTVICVMWSFSFSTSRSCHVCVVVDKYYTTSVTDLTDPVCMSIYSSLYTVFGSFTSDFLQPLWFSPAGRACAICLFLAILPKCIALQLPSPSNI